MGGSTVIAITATPTSRRTETHPGKPGAQTPLPFLRGVWIPRLNFTYVGFIYVDLPHTHVLLSSGVYVNVFCALLSTVPGFRNSSRTGPGTLKPPKQSTEVSTLIQTSIQTVGFKF